MQIIDRIRDRTKFLQLTQFSVSTYPRIQTYQVSITNSCANTFFSCLSSFIMGTVTPTPRHSEEKQARLMKKSRCFSCKKKGHIANNCSKKGKIAVILEGVSKNSNS